MTTSLQSARSDRLPAKLNRRRFLAGTAAVLILPAASRAQSSSVVLEARRASVQLAPEGYPTTKIWGYDGQAPGPELRLAQGARLRRLVNALEQPTTIHWHGIRIDNAMDGVPGLTQDAVAPGGTFDYDLTVPDAGTYWYHAHNQSPEQVGHGLYGALIVEEPEALDIDAEHVLILDDWRLTEDAQIAPDFAAMHDLSHGGRLGNFVTTNAAFAWRQSVRQNQRLRLRLINAANARIFPLALQGLDGWVAAYDGMPLPTPEKVSQGILLAPGQRVDLIVDVTAAEGEEAFLVHMDEDGGFAQAAFPVMGRASLARRGKPAPLPPNQGQTLGDLAPARSVDMRIEGGAMGGLRSAMLNGEDAGFREMARAGQFWAMAGSAGMPDAPLVMASRGETIRVRMANDTVFAHAMHLHGMHFREVMPGGAMGPMRDTLLLPARETREIAFLADNPGEWLFHCHMLSHAASGMMQRVSVT